MCKDIFVVRIILLFCVFVFMFSFFLFIMVDEKNNVTSVTHSRTPGFYMVLKSVVSHISMYTYLYLLDTYIYIWCEAWKSC